LLDKLHPTGAPDTALRLETLREVALFASSPVSNTEWFTDSHLIRAARFVGICLVVSFIVLNVFLRVEAYRFQCQAERLMADVQALKLRQSNWLEAERLISRWGKYGHYEGHCDASFCRYSIGLNSPGMALGNAGFWRHLDNHFVRLTAPFIFAYSGGRLATPASDHRRTRQRRLAEERSLHL
jgi:hypothetical protein